MSGPPAWWPGFLGFFWSDARATWVGHGLLTAFAPLLVSLPLVWLGVGSMVYPILVSTVALYYVVVRETADEAYKRGSGTWEDEDGLGVSGLIDRWGDSLGPAALSLGVWLGWWVAGLAG